MGTLTRSSFCIFLCVSVIGSGCDRVRRANQSRKDAAIASSALTQAFGHDVSVGVTTKDGGVAVVVRLPKGINVDSERRRLIDETVAGTFHDRVTAVLVIEVDQAR